jgi:hypothetical protein
MGETDDEVSRRLKTNETETNREKWIKFEKRNNEFLLKKKVQQIEKFHQEEQ